LRNFLEKFGRRTGGTELCTLVNVQPTNVQMRPYSAPCVGSSGSCSERSTCVGAEPAKKAAKAAPISAAIDFRQHWAQSNKPDLT